MGNDAGEFVGEAEPRVRAELKRVPWVAGACMAFFVLIAIGIGRYRSSLEIALLVLSNVACVGVVLWTARALRLVHADAEQARRASEARFRRLSDAGILGIVTSDAAGHVRDANDAFLELVGYSRAELRAGLLHSEVLDTDERDRTDRAALAEIRDRGAARPWEKELVHKDGTRVPVLVGVAALPGDEYIAFTLDQSERRRTERALAASEERFRHLSESGILGIIICDTAGNIDEANDEFLRIVGYHRDDVKSGTLRWTELTPPEWRALDEDAIRELGRAGAAKPWTKEYLRKDGTRAPVVVGVAGLDGVGSERAVAFVLDRSEMRRVDQARVAAVATAEREAQSRAEAEHALRQTEEQLRQAQKMDAIGKLAGSVAHDFNNLLSIVLSYSELLLADRGRTDPIYADLEQISLAARRAGDLTRQLLAFSRRQVLEPKVINLNEAIGGMTKMLRRVIGEDIELAFLPAQALGAVEVDPAQIEQVLLNLVVNARDAMPQGGKLTLETTNVVVDHLNVAEHWGAELGAYAGFSVSDTGVGMSAEVQARIFEPFFTTKAIDKGTGLGLSTVYGIVKQSGGHIAVFSEPAQGTAFKVYFPTVAAKPAPAERRSSPPATLEGSETVLIVEDDEAVRALAAAILRRHGYRVLEARSGGDALLICEQHPAPIHLLLTDVVMPLMSGRQLVQRIASLRSSIKVVFMSGHADDAMVRHGVLSSEFDFVQKPFVPSVLLAKLRAVLDAGGGAA